MTISQYLKEYGFEPAVNNPILYRLKKRGIFSNLFFGLSRLLGRAPFELFKGRFFNDASSRLVETPFLFTNLPKQQNMNILDFGANESYHPIYLAHMGHKVTGYDLADYPFSHSNLKFIKGNFLDNTIKSNSFDVSIAISAIEHCGLESYDSPVFSDGDLKIMKEIIRVTKKGGLIIVTVPFGYRNKDSFQRIYDTKALNDLLQGLTIVEEKYYKRNQEQTQWDEVSKLDAEFIEYIPERISDGLACVVCQK